MQINWKEQIDKVRHMVDSEPSLFAFCVRDWDITEQAGLRDLAWALARDESYATRNDAKGLLEMLEAHLTKHAPDVVESARLCEGACENHVGEVVTVHVTSPKGHDWGEFDYCEEAIVEDRRRGFTVEIKT